ncbi:MAG: DUF3108 domain-containing protein [Burkholderiaceae bacterium]|nr:DUF3108 domain-containing protein [Burkholderiaceae bacterium]
MKNIIAIFSTIKSHQAAVRLALGITLLALAQAKAYCASNLPPNAELHYQIKAVQHGIPLSGEAIVKWLTKDESDAVHYQIHSETRVILLGKILEARSQGALNDQGLAPEKFSEKRLNKPESNGVLDRISGQVQFSDAASSVKLKGNEQDRTSIVWQLCWLARQRNEQFAAGQTHQIWVVGRRDIDLWTLNVVGMEVLQSPMGAINAVHLTKVQASANKEQQIDIWLAPNLEWYPAKISFTDADGGHVEQTLSAIKTLASPRE